ncbi:MAG: phasin family protein [Steroidobacteraceae bacterium]
MFNAYPDIKSLADYSNKSLASFAQLTDIVTASFEKISRYQVEAAIEMANHGSARLHATAESVGSPDKFVARQTELTEAFVNANSQKWQEYLKLTAELQSGVTKWADDAKTLVTAQFAPKAA